MPKLRRKACAECKGRFFTSINSSVCDECTGANAKARDESAARDEAAIAAARPAVSSRTPQQVNPRGPDATEPASTASAAPKPKREPTKKAKE